MESKGEPEKGLGGWVARMATKAVCAYHFDTVLVHHTCTLRFTT